LSLNWKLYTNSTSPYLFSVKYPSTETPRVIDKVYTTVAFEITPNGDISTQNNGQTISFYQTNDPLKVVVEMAKADLPSDYSVATFPETVGDEPAIEMMVTKPSDSSRALYIFVKHNEILYEIAGLSSDQNLPMLVQSLEFAK